MRRLVASVLVGCSGSVDPADLLDPEVCRDCHPAHFAEWESSMHAHAAEDPVFLAMNARGQRETDGALGDFCVQCHAPVAVRLGLAGDGDLDGVEPHLRGVTCAFCHQIDTVDGDHNAAVGWAFDGVMRGGVPDPVRSPAHQASYSGLHDRNDNRSADVCGACHDVVTPVGLHLERTYAEYGATVFADGLGRQTCAHCHMPGSPDVIAQVDGVPERERHDHSMPGVDVALIPFPGIEAQTALVQASLDDTLLATLCVVPMAGGTEVVVALENVLAGHDWPSGASHDRRAWVEVVATEAGEVLLASGVIADGERLDAVDDPTRWELHDVARGDGGDIAHMFWDATSLEERALTAAQATGLPHAVEQRWPIPGRVPDTVRLRVRLRPVGLDILDDLVQSGDLDPTIRAAMPTFDLASTALTWQGEVGTCVQ